MKTTVNVFGITTLFFLVIGTVFKIQHWPGGAIAVTLGLGLFNFIFQLFLLIYNMIQKNGALTKITQIFGFFAAVFYPIGILFKIQHWPGSGLFLLSGTFFLFYVFTPLLLVAISKTDSPFRTLNIRTIFSIAIFALLFTLALGASGPSNTAIANLVTVATNEERELHHLGMAVETTCANFEIKKLNGPEDSIRPYYDKCMAAMMMSKSLVKYIADIKIELLRSTDMVDTLTSIKFSTHPDNYDIPTHYLIGSDPENPTGKAVELKVKIKNFKEGLSGLLPQLGRSVNLGPDISDGYSFAEEKMGTWEEISFYHHSLAGVIATLTQIQVQTRIAEAQVVNYLFREAERASHRSDK